MTTPSRTALCVASGVAASVGLLVGVGEVVCLLEVGVGDVSAFCSVGLGEGLFGCGPDVASFLFKISVL